MIQYPDVAQPPEASAAATAVSIARRLITLKTRPTVISTSNRWDERSGGLDAGL